MSFRIESRGGRLRLASAAALLLSSFGAAAAPQTVDDITTYSYAQGFAGIGSEADLPVSRTFPGRIVSLVLTIIDGKADDIGFVGNIQVTNQFPQCRDVGAVTAPVDVSSQVAISGNTASFLLRAVENCCCSTGWGPATQGDRPPATFHWQVTYETEQCDANSCGQCSTDPKNLTNKGTLFEKKLTEPCSFLGGELGLGIDLKVAETLTPAVCNANKCETRRKASGDLALTAFLCGGRSQSLTFAAEAERDTSYGVKCNTDTCKQECDETASCQKDSVEVSAALGVEQQVGWAFTKAVPFTSSAHLDAFCTFTGGLSGSLAYKSESDTKTGAPEACENCNKVSGILKSGVTGKADCNLSLVAAGWTREAGCKDCADAKLATEVEVEHSSGECATETCLKSKLTFDGTLQTPQLCFSVFGFVVKARAAGHVGVNCPGDTCSTADQECRPTTSFDDVFATGPNQSCSE